MLESPNAPRLLCLGGYNVLSMLMKVLLVSPTEKRISSCPCLGCAVLGQLSSFRGQEPDFAAEPGDPEPSTAAAAVTGECTVLCLHTGMGSTHHPGLWRQRFGFNTSFPLSAGEFVT